MFVFWFGVLVTSGGAQPRTHTQHEQILGRHWHIGTPACLCVHVYRYVHVHCTAVHNTHIPNPIPVACMLASESSFGPYPVVPWSVVRTRNRTPVRTRVPYFIGTGIDIGFAGIGFGMAMLSL